jgi:hypothetical protein
MGVYFTKPGNNIAGFRVLWGVAEVLSYCVI